ncbi:MAG: WYL domain-containing protein [Roseburia sp.]|nr:WYL domain-containing protein [Roseburia sp.]
MSNNHIGKKLLPLAILEILHKRTNEYESLSTAEMLSALRERGINCDRKTLYANVRALQSAGYEIMRKRGECVRYYVIDRAFDTSELRILLDAVQAAVFITERKSSELCKKIAELAGESGADIIKSNIAAFNITKTTNKFVNYSVSAISEAIIRKKKITFEYFDYACNHSKVFRGGDAKKLYTVNPVATVFSDDKYYLLCYHDNHDNITHYRIDRMERVAVTDTPTEEREELKRFDIKRHKKQIFGMFSGETLSVTFEAEREPFVIDAVFDKFGAGTAITEVGGNKLKFSADVQLSNPFFAWVCSFGGKLKIESPISAVEKFREFIDGIYTKCYS